ncbi:BppU family phage baseplate upper protein [Enterococcus faecium]|uniref:BppU family phage baseplate upper protein n=1 Tax=Enterococcus faecium TaxID=1352 RepID=UPI000F506BA9|nr:BppU family phage baseplate upper protein [Enterococcus faecium]ROY16660.1 phage baseplate upper protein [Enterococcus faecium]HAR1751232.1 phage baseplate upper protein [Enterococcus faecium]
MINENQFFKIANKPIIIDTTQFEIIDNGTIFFSHDRGTAKIQLELKNGENVFPITQGSLVPVRLTFPSETAEDGIAKHDYLATIDDAVNGRASIILEKNILGYQGIINGSVYVNLPNSQTLDTAGRFRFRVERSPIDESTPAVNDYYFNGFNWFVQQVSDLSEATKEDVAKLLDTANNKSNELQEKVAQLSVLVSQAKKDLLIQEAWANSSDGTLDFSRVKKEDSDEHSFMKYRGISLLDSDDPNDFLWDRTAEYINFLTIPKKANESEIIEGENDTTWVSPKGLTVFQEHHQRLAVAKFSTEDITLSARERISVASWMYRRINNTVEFYGRFNFNAATDIVNVHELPIGFRLSHDFDDTVWNVPLTVARVSNPASYEAAGIIERMQTNLLRMGCNAPGNTYFYGRWYTDDSFPK